MKRAYIFLLLAIMAVIGCRPRYTAVKNSNKTTPTTHKLTAKDIVSHNNKAKIPIDFLNVTDASLAFNNDGKDYFMSMNMKVIRGKEISVSVMPMLGIELFRIRFTPERFHLFDKFNRQYCDNSYQYLSKMLKTEVSYAMIEALLLNNLFSIDPNAMVDEAYSPTQLDDRFLLTSLREFSGYRHTFELSPDYMVTSTSINQPVTQILRADYSNFKSVDKVVFPTTIELKTNLEQNNFNLKVDVKRVEINKVFSIPTVDFERYTKVECVNML